MNRFFKSNILLTVLFFSSFCVYTQKVEEELYTYDFIRAPLNPLPSSVKSYQSEVIVTYEAEVLAEKAKEGADYDTRLAIYQEKFDFASEREDSLNSVYEQQKVEAIARYDSLMTIYNEKSHLTKYVENRVLRESQKPRMIYPSRSYVKYPIKPQKSPDDYQKIFNKELLEEAYLKLEGFTKSKEANLKITVTLYGFEYLDPVMRTSSRNVYNTQSQTTTTVTSYWHELFYRHPMHVKVALSSGEVLMDEVPEGINKYVVYKTRKRSGSPSLINSKGLKTGFQEQIVATNLSVISEEINKRFGFSKKSREVKIFKVTSKKADYSVYQKAYEHIILAYSNRKDDVVKSDTHIKEAITLWESQAASCEPYNKKAHINAKIGKATHFNLCEAYLCLGDYDNAEQQLSKIMGLNPSNKDQDLINKLRADIKGLK